MSDKTMILENPNVRFECRMNGREIRCALTRVPAGRTVTFTIADGIENGGGNDRFGLPFPQGDFPFFGDGAALTAGGDGLELRRVLPGTGTIVCYRFRLEPERPGLIVTAWFEGEALYARSIRFMDITVTGHPYTRWLGVPYGSDPAAPVPCPGGPLSEMDQNLRFYGAAGLCDEGDALLITGGGKPVVARDGECIRLMACPDLLGFNDEAGIFGPKTPMEARLSFTAPSDSPAVPGGSFPRREPGGRTVTITSGTLRVSVCSYDDGMALSEILGRDGGFLPPSRFPLFRLRLYDRRTGRQWTADSASGFSRTLVRQYERETRLYFMEPRGYGDFTLLLTARIMDGNRVEWRTRILNDNPDVSVLSASYPMVWFGGADMSVLMPDGSGVVAPDACRYGWHYRQIYPAHVPLPYFAVYPRDGGSGLYAGVHDAGGGRKDIAFTTFPAAECGRIMLDFPAPNMGAGANSFSLPGAMVWQEFDGDWYDATCIYRDFVHTGAAWMPAVGVQGREDTPRWMREMPFWIMDWAPNTNPDADPIPISIRPRLPEGMAEDEDAWVRDAVALQKALGVPMGYHVYNWHWIPFNNDYPHYFPVKECFPEGVRRLQQAGVRVMPYINGRLWDVLDKRDEDYRFGSEALPWTTKDADGNPLTETYAAHERDGSLVRLAAMCPKTAFWRAEMESIVRRLFLEYHVDAVYIDQVAAAPPNLCMDPGHNHLPGGGDWWNHGYWEMMDRLNLIKPADRAFTTESNGEVYAGSFDGMLTWIWLEPGLVPAFPLIYAGAVVMFGRNLNGAKKDDVPYFRYHVAQQLLYGQQIGWINADVVYHPEKLAFLRSMVGLRWRLRELFASGRPLRPPLITGRLPRIRSSAGMGSPVGWKIFEAGAVLAAVWRDPAGAVYVLAVNTAAETARCAVRCRTDEWGTVKNAVPQLHDSLGADRWEAALRDGDFLMDCSLAPLGFLVLSLQ